MMQITVTESNCSGIRSTTFKWKWKGVTYNFSLNCYGTRN